MRYVLRQLLTAAAVLALLWLIGHCTTGNPRQFQPHKLPKAPSFSR